jgi:hypothetical protein
MLHRIIAVRPGRHALGVERAFPPIVDRPTDLPLAPTKVSPPVSQMPDVRGRLSMSC